MPDKDMAVMVKTLIECIEIAENERIRTQSRRMREIFLLNSAFAY